MRVIFVIAAMLLTPVVGAQTIVFDGATVMTVSGETIENGTVIVRDGTIVEVGQGLATPSGAERIDLFGKVLIPGLVDTHSHLGGVSGGDRSGPLHPAVRAMDGIDIQNDDLWRARSGGLTTLNVMPGSGHLMSGQTIYLKLRDGATTIHDWLFCDNPDTDVCGSMKMANGTNSMRGKPFPGTRAKSAAMVRDLFVRAQHYAEKRDGDEPPARDLGLEAVAQILSRERRVQHHTHRQDDVATVLRLKKEFGFDVVIQHGTETWMLAEEIAAAGVGVSFTLVDSPGGKEEIMRMRMDAPAILEKAGVVVSINTDDWVTDSRLLLRTAAMAVRHGMSRDGALASITLNAAMHLGLEDRIGSIEAGKDADLVVLSGDPFSVRTQVLETWVEGKQIYDASDPAQAAYETGGWNVYRSAMTHHHEGCNQ